MFPSNHGTQNLVKISLFAVLTYIGALIQIPMYPVPISLQTFFVILAGLLLGPVNGAKSQILYIIMGLIGLPVFTGGGGVGYVLDPRFGFVLGFVLLAYICGLAKGKSIQQGVTIILGTIVLYLVGISYIWTIVNNVLGGNVTFMAVAKSMLVFILGDIIKIIVAIPLAAKIRVRIGIFT